MEKKGKSFKRSYIILIVILLMAVVSMFLLLSFADNTRKSIPLSNFKTSTTSSKKIESVEVANVSPFNASLEQIINRRTFDNDYNVPITYGGAIFNFNCTKFDEETSTCVSGSGLMDIGSALIPLYTYENESENYLLHQEDYHIIVNENYVILTTNYVGKQSGKIKVLDKKGKTINEIGDVLTGYKLNDQLVKRLYPEIDNDLIYHYICDDNLVKIASSELIEANNTTYEEDIDNATCK